jgi:hypothetical protein
MDRNRVLTIAIIVVAVLFLFNPFGRRRSLERLIPAPASQETLDPLAATLERRGKTPEDYVIGLFEDHDIVMLGEFPKIKQQVQLASRLVPRLYQAGVRNMGFEYMLYENQARLDRLITAAEFDQAEAERLFFDFVVLWGFEDYLEVVRAAWRVNKDRSPGSTPFRLVGLNVRRNWEHIQSQEDVEDPEVIKKVLAEGIPDLFMADVIQKEFVDRGQKALVYVNLQNAFTRYRNKAYEQNAEEKGLEEVRRAGNIVYDRIGERVVTVALHAPWPDRETLSQVNYPVGGVIDRLMFGLPRESRSVGFDVRATAFAGLEVTSEIYRTGYDSLTFGDMVDGYLLLGPLGDYELVTPIPNFVNEQNLAEAVRRFPGPKQFDPRREPTPADFTRLIDQDLESLQRVIDQFE